MGFFKNMGIEIDDNFFEPSSNRLKRVAWISKNGYNRFLEIKNNNELDSNILYLTYKGEIYYDHKIYSFTTLY